MTRLALLLVVLAVTDCRSWPTPYECESHLRYEPNDPVGRMVLDYLPDDPWTCANATIERALARQPRATEPAALDLLTAASGEWCRARTAKDIAQEGK